MAVDCTVDTSQLKGLTFHCVDGCALCCLCEPEVLPDDDIFSDSSLSRYIERDEDGAFIKRKGAAGPCVFLSGRKCTIYERRPHFCRTFPVHMFASWRLQAVPNLSCPGIGDGDVPLTDLLANWGCETLSSALEEVRSDYAARKIDPLEMMDELDGFDFRGAAARAMDELDPMEAWDLAMDTFTLDTELLPIFIDKAMEWRMVRIKGDSVILYSIDDMGNTRRSGTVSADELELHRPDEGARSAMMEYLSRLGEMDYIKDHILWQHTEDRSYTIDELYDTFVREAVHELWWRSALHSHLYGDGALDTKAVEGGIMMYDMDILDVQTIGRWV